MSSHTNPTPPNSAHAHNLKGQTLFNSNPNKVSGQVVCLLKCVQAKVVIATHLLPYLADHHPLASLSMWSVPTCHLTLAIGLT
jgi:hypothetical protein